MALDNAQKLPFGKYFAQHGSFLFNFPALIIDLIINYLLACGISALIGNMRYSKLNNMVKSE